MEEALRKIAQDNGYHYNRAIEIFQNHSNEEVLNFIKNSDSFHHAENFREIWERIEKGLNEIVSKSESNNENILLVTHGVIIRNVIDKFSDGVNFEGKINNSSISILEYSGSNFRVVSFNQ